MGAQLVREVANKTSDQTGDGTTTATLLAQAIVREGMHALDEGANPMLLKRRHRGGHRRRCRRAAAGRAPVEGDELVHVATIAAKEDEVIGGVVAEALEHVGPEGVVTIEESDEPGIAVASSRAWSSRTAGSRSTWCATRTGWRPSSRTRSSS